MAFEAEFDEPIGVTQYSCTKAHYFHIVITENSDNTTKQNYDYVVVTATVNKYWRLDKQNGPYNTTAARQLLKICLLLTFQGMTHYENQLKNRMFYTDLLIKRGSVANSQEMSIRIGDQIDEAIQFLKQSLMRLQA